MNKFEHTKPGDFVYRIVNSQLCVYVFINVDKYFVRAKEFLGEGCICLGHNYVFRTKREAWANHIHNLNSYYCELKQKIQKIENEMKEIENEIKKVGNTLQETAI